ncbi:MAG TPA: hypothetical protein VKC55_09285 [Actinomycetota bacterium]|jgi:hypothetical protein|nr:hypothetical protein [Actinomycetota bacterium]
MKRIFIGARGTDDRWRNRPVEVLARSKGRPRNALVEFDTGERVVVPTYAGGVGSTLRIPREAPTSDRRAATRN